MTQTPIAPNPLIDRLYAQARDVARAMGLDIPAAATADQLEKVERTVNQALPPSFRHLLMLQNGWPSIWQGFDLAGTDDLLGAGRFGKKLALQHAEFWSNRGIDPYDVKARRSYRPVEGLLVPWRLLVVGLGPNGDLLLFDIRQRRPDGEAPFVHTHPDGSIVTRWPTFDEWLWNAATADAS